MTQNNAFETPRPPHAATNNNLSAGSQYRSSHKLSKNHTGSLIKKYKLLVILLTMGFVICLALILMLNRRVVSETAIPVIEAEPGPIKIRPTESNHAVLHSEKTIYSVLSSQEPVAKIENLLSEPEKPQAQNPSLPEDFMQSLVGVNNEDATTVAKSGETDISNQPPANESQQSIVNLINSIENPSYVDDSGEDAEAMSDNDESLNINLNIPTVHQSIFLDEAIQQPFLMNSEKQSVLSEKQSNQIEMADVKVKSSKIAAPKVSSKQPVVQKTIYRAQVCSALSKKAAEQLWLKTYKKAPQLFASYKPFYEKIDLGANIGIRYRVQIGQFSGEAVHKFCQRLKSKGFDCVSVRQNSR